MIMQLHVICASYSSLTCVF